MQHARRGSQENVCKSAYSRGDAVLQIKEDPEWEQFCMVPNLTEGWNNVRDAFHAQKEPFKVTIVNIRGSI